VKASPASSSAHRPPLSRERVLQAAIELADRSGIEALTMRRLGKELGVEAMTLYYYVPNKDDILDGIVDIVVSEIDVPSDGPDWKAAMRRSAISAHDVLLRHPWACGLILSSAGVRPARMRYMDAVLGGFRKAGFSAEMTDHAYHALDSHIMGFTMWETRISAEVPDLKGAAATFLRELPVDDYPHLVEHIHQHLKERNPDDDEGEFEFGLDLILDGLDRVRDPA
jgi:AcrR family transcriptional regulator